MQRIGVQSLRRAIEGMGEHRDLEASLRRHLARLEALPLAPDTRVPTPPEPGLPHEKEEPPSSLFLALCESVAQCYEERRRPESATEVVWEAFASRPGLVEYRTLRDWAERSGSWPEWREKAWAFLRGAEGRDAEATAILLSEDRLDDAWAQAQRRGASDAEWLELARRREQDHPEESVEIYRGRIERLLPSAEASAYRESLQWLRRMKSLLSLLGRDSDFEEFLQGLRARLPRRPRWLRLLDDAFGSGT